MPRPATGAPKWNPTKKVWQARVSYGGKRVPVDMPGIAQDDEERARRMAKIVSARIRSGCVVINGSSEFVSEWSEKWLKDREARGIVTVRHDRGRLKRHVLPTIGALELGSIQRADIERVVELLDKRIGLDEKDPDHLSWKTASNVWTLVTKMFDDAVNSKNRSLRVRADDPTEGVRPPERGDAKAKQFLYPSEFLKLVSCIATSADGRPLVPIRFRILYAAATYTFARAGELEALTWDDVDLEHGVIHITKAVDRRTGKVKSTKSGESRRIPIEPTLVPLLERLNADRPKNDPGTSRVFWLPDDEDRAVLLRQHLLAAGVKRAELFLTDSRHKWITFHDLRATGITWMAVRGDDPLRIKQRAGHRSFSTTEGYIREAENLTRGFGEPFPSLPVDVTKGFGLVSVFWSETTPKTPVKLWSKGGSNP